MEKLKAICSLMFILLIVTSCHPTEDTIPNLLEKKYANLYVNNENQKRAVMAELKAFLNQENLDEKNLDKVVFILNKMNDGHVILRDELNRSPVLRMDYTNDLEFFKGANLIRSCKTNCNPVLPEDKYQILSIDNTTLEDWIKSEERYVQGSSSWGRKFRALRMLNNSNKKLDINLKLIDSQKRIIETTLSFVINKKLSKKCIEFNRINEHNSLITINTLWCDKNPKNIFEGFKKEWDETIKNISTNDKIILDLRENNGGGDDEVRYVLNTFIDHSVFMYKYQYLFSTSPGLKKYFSFLVPNSNLGPIGFDHSLPATLPPLKFYKNTIITLTSSGCFSSCEGLVQSLKNAKRSVVIGETTHGGAGAPLFYPVKGTHYSLNLPSCLVWQADGKLYEGVGVTPDEFMIQKIDEIDDSLIKSAMLR